MTNRGELIQVANNLADAARAAILPYFRRDYVTDNKLTDGFDPVTEADRAAERAMRHILHKDRSEDGIIGEEYGRETGRSGLDWVLDPIDGTRAFLCGAPSWGVLIAVADQTGPVYGLIDQPYIGERFEGGWGLSRMRGPAGELALNVRKGRRLDQATLMTTFPEVGTPAEGRAFANLSKKTCLTRYGLDCYAYGLLALGQIDLVVEAGLQYYDIAAPMAVVRAAGGIVTDWQGNPDLRGGPTIAAATPELHAAALEVLNART